MIEMKRFEQLLSEGKLRWCTRKELQEDGWEDGGDYMENARSPFNFDQLDLLEGEFDASLVLEVDNSDDTFKYRRTSKYGDPGDVWIPIGVTTEITSSSIVLDIPDADVFLGLLC